MGITQMSINSKWINKLWSIPTMGYYSVIKKKQTINIGNYMDESKSHYASEGSQTKKEYIL